MIQENIAAKRKSREKKPANRTIHPQEQHPPQHPVISFIISADTPFFGVKQNSVFIINPFSRHCKSLSFSSCGILQQMYITWMKLID